MNPFKCFIPLLLFSLLTAVQAEPKSPVMAPGYRSLEFTPPAPGSYQLPALGDAADGRVLTSEDKSINLHELMGDRIVLLSFIYSTCSDVNGCPLATAVFHKIKNRLRKEPEVARQLRLLTLSFNPEHDTPEQMKHYSQGLADDTIDWRFLTTASETDLRPILDRYRQTVQKVYDDQGRFTGTFSHILRVYLIDRDRQLRNIYSVSFLHPDTLINDIKTLLYDSKPSSRAAARPIADLYRPGDYKQGYDDANYVTHSIALSARTGKPADLMKTIHQPPKGLPAMPIPANNPITVHKVRLGRKLFYDRRLSLNNTFSCAMCHIPEQGFSSNEMKTAVGIEGRTVRRNSPTIYNVGYARSLFHDARETTLEQQVWGPLLAPNEMGNPAIGQVIEKLKSDAEYVKLFTQAFDREPGMETVGMAIASYERTLNSANSAFDRWYYGHEKQALSASAERGFRLFTGKANCSNCHTIAEDHALFTDHALHNTGIGYAEAMSTGLAPQRIQVSPGVYIDVAPEVLASVSEPKVNDLGRYEVTQKPEDRWKYKTPTLRNISLTAPYMHDGSKASLTEVVEFYDQGGIANETLDPLIKPLNLTNREKTDLTAFLTSLTGDNTEELISDAFAAPVGDAE